MYRSVHGLFTTGLMSLVYRLGLPSFKVFRLGHFRHASRLFSLSPLLLSKLKHPRTANLTASGRTRIASWSRPNHLMAAQSDHPRPACAPGRPSSSGGQTEQSNPEANPSKKRKTGKKKVVPLAVQLRARIHQAAKHADQHEDAFLAFDESKVADVKLSPDCLVTLLFLAAGGDQWETYVYDKEKRDEYVKTKRMEKCDEILAVLTESSGPSGAHMVEMCYTALARKEAILGNGEGAFQHVMSMPRSQPKKNRCFLPALAAFAVSGAATRAMEAYDALMEAGLEPGEAEFSKILEAISKAPEMEWSKVESVLAHMAKETTELEKGTIKVVRSLFDSRTDFDASCSICRIREDGYCERCDDTLQAIDLDDCEYSQFAKGIASLAKRHGKRTDEFDNFVNWLEEHGPFGIIIDAANVAFYNQNFESGGFNFAQIEAVVERVGSDHPDLKPLVVLHINRTRGPAASTPKARALLKRLTEQNKFYAAPMGSNDDWYWMYAAVVAGEKGILVSNDEMRDHLFNLLAPKYFNKWKQRHQMRYSFNGDPSTLSFESPPPFTRCTQMLRKRSGETSWMFPIGRIASDVSGGNSDHNTGDDSAAGGGVGEGADWLCCRWTMT